MLRTRYWKAGSLITDFNLDAGTLDFALPVNLVARMGLNAQVSWDGTYIYGHLGAVANQVCSLIGFGTVYGYGTYQWKAYFDSEVTNIAKGHWGFERYHGDMNQGGAIFYCNNANDYKVMSGGGGSTQTSTLAGEDWTSEKTFKIDWSASSVKFYVDGTLEATHTTVVPTENMAVLYVEAYTGATAPASGIKMYFRDFEVL